MVIKRDFALDKSASLEQALGIHFNDQSHLELALVHSSYVNENPGLAPASNERLEFLGDAVLGLVFAEGLYSELPHSAEGGLTQLRSDLVRRSTLASIARSIGLGDHLFLGKGEESSGGRNKPANLAGAMEAVIGAVFLDQGWDATRDFILRLFAPKLEQVIRQGAAVDYKSQLQHLFQSRQQVTPSYHIAETKGPDHDRMFTAEVIVGNTVLGRGYGKSKKIAQTEAAYSVLEKMEGDFTK